jgi:hypothetical protein
VVLEGEGARARLEESDSITDAEEESVTSTRRRPACSTAPSNGVDTSPVERQLSGQRPGDGDASTLEEEQIGKRAGCNTVTACAPAGQPPEEEQGLLETLGPARQYAAEELLRMRTGLDAGTVWAPAGQTLEEEQELPETPDAVSEPMCMRAKRDTGTAWAPAGQAPQLEQGISKALGPPKQVTVEEPICVRAGYNTATA